ncbi:MAG: glutathione S-transferase family protein [Rhodoferax sp.]
MITLYQFDPTLGLPNASPFCMKVETYLRMCGLPYQAPPMQMSTLQRAPKGKLPYIDDADGVRVADSSHILAHLAQRYGTALDDWMSPQQRAQALALQRLLEDSLYWSLLYLRWVDEAGWTVTRTAFFGKFPAPLRWLLPPLGRRNMRRALWAQGTGRHSRAEILARAQAEIDAVAALLGDKTYVMGEQPCSWDAGAYAFLANVVEVGVDSPVRQYARGHANLLAYCERMRQRYYV